MSSALLLFASRLAACLLVADPPPFPDKIYGVNIGSWLVVEPWMLPAEWESMGGEMCYDCSKCISSEFAFAQAYPTTVDDKFKEHWESWFNQEDVDQFVDAGLNTVRIPVPWILDRRTFSRRTTEFYPKGGILELQRGLRQLNAAGITVILDHHAPPGVASPNQNFAGRCTDDVQFYTQYNYHRALVWAAVMTALSHVDPNFGSVAALQAVNEPITDASKTPGYGEYQKNFVQTVRAVEISLGIPVPDLNSPALPRLRDANNVTSAFAIVANSSSVFSSEVLQVLVDAAPVFEQVARQLTLNTDFALGGLRCHLSRRRTLITNFMDSSWQHNNPSNPADAAIGPQAYDIHFYYAYGGVAAPNEQAYLTHVCNLNRIQTDVALGNDMLWFGEWSLATQFNATDEFLVKWADAQKYSYSKGAGWLSWNFKIENSSISEDKARQWSYMEGLRRGYFTKDPSQFHDPNICAPYINKTTTT
ncbi:glycoside hydrolase family 5 protein [Hebeloma cylindrosporum]|uniref:Glycoside hydrolase family 5 protein n=1 Tax=Hebeloma cylindrosporum TaxID=76867 RepID=A0A0C3CKT3_HEBCY|nr:glycoside hydrolase family 5 protein [Hebeloma cylindrosporum h7]